VRGLCTSSASSPLFLSVVLMSLSIFLFKTSSDGVSPLPRSILPAAVQSCPFKGFPRSQVRTSHCHRSHSVLTLATKNRPFQCIVFSVFWDICLSLRLNSCINIIPLPSVFSYRSRALELLSFSELPPALPLLSRSTVYETGWMHL